MNYFYARISNKNLSFDNQLNLLNEYCFKFNIKIDNLVKDISNGFEQIKGNTLFELLQNLTKKDCLFVFNLSRISRDGRNLIEFYDILKSKQVKLVLLRDCIEDKIIKDSPKSLNVILGNITELDAEYVSIITKNALNELKNKGIKLGRPFVDIRNNSDEIIKMYDSGHRMQEVADHFNISIATVSRIIDRKGQNKKRLENITHNSDIANVPLDIKLSIWADWKLDYDYNYLAEKYNFSVETINQIIQSLKGGGNW